MSFCLNPVCPSPQNPASAETCRACGTRLRLKDRYQAIAPLGQGGFGRTFLAIDTDKPSKPRCVIKQFLPIGQGTRFRQKAAQLFEQEALRLEELGHHPQIPALLAHFSQEAHQYLVQEFVAGKTLSTVLSEQGAFAEAQVRDVLLGLLPVLEFIHQRDVIHRDIKPANIIAVLGSQIMGRSGGSSAIGANAIESGSIDWSRLLQALAQETAQGLRNLPGVHGRFSDRLSQELAKPWPELTVADLHRCQEMAAQFARYRSLTLGQRQYLVADASRLLYELRRRYARSPSTTEASLVLVDFGAAKSIKTSTSQTGTAIGSPEYLAPEQARGKAVFASDLYSLGVTCLHLLTNTSPADLFDVHADCWIWSQQLPTPISDRLHHILNKLVAPAPRDRYASAAEVLHDLHPQPVALPRPAATVLPAALPHSSPYSSVQSRSGATPFPPAIARSRSQSPPGRGPASPFVTPSSAIPAAVSAAEAISSASPPLPLISHSPPISHSPSPKSPRSRKARRSQPQPAYTLQSPGRVAAIVLSPTEPILVSSSGTTIRLWNSQTGQPLRTLTGHLDIVRTLAISADGKLLVSGSADKTIRLWELPSGNRLGHLTLHTDTVLAVAIAPDGRTLASSSLHDPIVLWDLAAGQERERLYGHTQPIGTLAFSPDGQILVSGSHDATLKLWQVETGQELRSLTGHTQTVSSLVFSPDGATIASGSTDGTVKLWSTRTRRQKRTLTVAGDRVSALALTADGKTLLTGGDTLQLWSLRTGKELSALPNAIASICALSVCPSATEPRLAIASWEGAIQVWRV